MSEQKKYFVYKYYKNGSLVYVGKATGNPFTRYWNHVKKDNYKGPVPFDCVDEVGIIRFDMKMDMEICELYLIMKHKPILNELDCHPNSEPTLEVIGIPDEERYTISEFVNLFNKGNSGRIVLRNIPFPSEMIATLENGRREREKWKTDIQKYVTLYYTGETLDYLFCNASDTRMKYWVKEMAWLTEMKADFSEVDCIETYCFSTAVEAKIFSKYMFADRMPKWCRETADICGGTCLTLSGVAMPRLYSDEEISESGRYYMDSIEDYNQKKDYYHQRYLGGRKL